MVNYTLSVYFNRILPQKLIPKFALLWSHLTAQRLCTLRQMSVIGQITNIHKNPPGEEHIPFSRKTLRNAKASPDRGGGIANAMPERFSLYDHLLLVAVISDVLYLSTFCSQNVHK